MNTYSVKKDKKYFIFHISSVEVLGSVISFNEKKNKPNIDFSVSEKIDFNDNNFDDEIFRENLVEKINKISKSLYNYLNIVGISIENAFVFLAPPLVRKNIFTLVDERMSSFKISEKYLENIINKGGEVEENEVLLEAEIISIKANDYDVQLGDLLNKKISKLEISFMDSIMIKKDEKMIDGILKDNFSFIDVTFLAFLPTFFNQINNIYNISEDFSFLDFSGEFSDFGLYVDNEVKTIAQISFGVNKILRILMKEKIAKNLKDAEYIFDLYLSNGLDKLILKKIKKVILKERDILKEFFEKNTKNVKYFKIPKKTFVLAPFGMTNIVKDLEVFDDIEFINKSVLRYFVDISEEKYFNIFLALEAEFIF